MLESFDSDCANSDGFYPRNITGRTEPGGSKKATADAKY
jgi:hypothetical protein